MSTLFLLFSFACFLLRVVAFTFNWPLGRFDALGLGLLFFVVAALISTPWPWRRQG